MFQKFHGNVKVQKLADHDEILFSSLRPDKQLEMAQRGTYLDFWIVQAREEVSASSLHKARDSLMNQSSALRAALLFGSLAHCSWHSRDPSVPARQGCCGYNVQGALDSAEPAVFDPDSDITTSESGGG